MEVNDKWLMHWSACSHWKVIIISWKVTIIERPLKTSNLFLFIIFLVNVKLLLFQEISKKFDLFQQGRKGELTRDTRYVIALRGRRNRFSVWRAKFIPLTLHIQIKVSLPFRGCLPSELYTWSNFCACLLLISQFP